MNEELKSFILVEGATIKLPSHTKQTLFGHTKIIEGATILANTFAIGDMVAGVTIDVMAFSASKPLFSWRERMNIKLALKIVGSMTEEDKLKVGIENLEEKDFKINGTKYRMLTANEENDGVYSAVRMIWAKQILIVVSCSASSEDIFAKLDSIVEQVVINPDALLPDED